VGRRTGPDVAERRKILPVRGLEFQPLGSPAFSAVAIPTALPLHLYKNGCAPNLALSLPCSNIRHCIEEEGRMFVNKSEKCNTSTPKLK
jgi:hypothetical protein